jgi:CO/xanthine dehydrogenase FAD-binding subunit
VSVVIAQTVSEALDAVGDDPRASYLAGGTDFMVEVNAGVRVPELVVALSRIADLQGWRVDGDELVLGSGVTYTELQQPALAELAPGLAFAARTVGSPQIRNAGTIGGNLGTASPAGDTLPVLVALGASVEVASRSGVRVVPIADFLLGPKQNALARGELVQRVRVPIRRGPQEYLKVGVRNAMVIAVASLALSVDVDRRHVGVGLGSVGPVALGAPDACAWLATRLQWTGDAVTLDDRGTIDEFADMVAETASPIDDHRSTAAYRRHAVRVLAARAVRRVVS